MAGRKESLKLGVQRASLVARGMSERANAEQSLERSVAPVP